MDVTWSVGLVQTSLTHPDYLVVQCWVHAAYLSPDTVKLVPQSSFKWGWNTHSWHPTQSLMAVIDHSFATIPFVITSFLALLTDLTNWCHDVAKYQILIQHPWTNCKFVMSLQLIMLCQWICLYICMYHLFILFICVLTYYEMSSWCS